MPRLILICLFTCLTVGSAFAQTKKIDSLQVVAKRTQAVTSAVMQYDSIPKEGIRLNKGWKYHPGDNSTWASPTFDDRSWQSIDPTKPLRELTQVSPQGIGWLRLHLQVGDQLRQQPLALSTLQFCALEVYLNGRLLYRQGIVSAQPNQVKAYTGLNTEPVRVVFNGQADQIIAIRFAPWPYWRLFNQQVIPYLLQASLADYSQQKRFSVDQQDESLLNGIGVGICLLLTLLHTAFFVYDSTQHTNLYFAFYTLTLTTFFGTLHVFTNQRFDQVTEFIGGTIAFNAIIQMMFLWPLRALYSLFNRTPNGIYYGLWLVLPLILVLLLAPLFPPSQTWIYLIISTIPMLVALVEQLRLTWQAVQVQKRGAYMIASGFGVALLFIVGRILLSSLSILPNSISNLFLFAVTLSPVFSISLYLAREFSLDSQLLQVKLRQVQQLSAQAIAQEKEKQELLAQQNETLEEQVTERTAQLQQSLDHLKATQAQLIQKEKMASLGELTAGIAHEIQNPLNFVNNFSEVSTELVTELEEEQQKPEPDTDLEAELLSDLKQNLQKITHHGGRASSIVKGMLEHSRTSSGEMQPTNLNALADEYLRLAYHGLRAKDKDFTCELVTHFDPTIGEVAAMAQEMGRVLLNLFTNGFYAVKQRAAKAEPDYKPSINLTTLKTKSGVEIRVSDNGTGMPEAVLQKIFQPFFTTKPTGEGTGLGLSLSYDIVTRGHGGNLSVKSQEGKGTEFIIELSMVFPKNWTARIT